MAEEVNTYLKRGKSKITGSIKKDAFYNFYDKNAKEKKVPRVVYNKFIKELLERYSTAIVETGLELKINKIGKIRIRSNKLHFFNKEGKRNKNLRVNWQKTWEYWHSKYPELNRQEITEIKNKTVIYHENEHSQQEFYSHYWDNLTANLKYKSFYGFKPSRQYSRLIARVVKDPNRKVFYYG
jgi:hypothetical protein